MVIGILGGGQLAKMMALAGYPMGQEFIVLDPSPDAAAGRVARLLQGDYDNPEKLHELAERADVVTFDFENVPVPALERLTPEVPVYPGIKALATAQDRCNEKELFHRFGIPTARFARVDSLEDLKSAVEETGLPAILKTRRMGYDGKGQQRIHTTDEIEQAWRGINGQPAILEALVPFEREVSLIAVRGQAGEQAFYPLVHNVHKDGILRVSTAPYRDPELQARAEQWVQPMMEHLDYVGVMAVEFFVHDGGLWANEMAPRVHNTGHWTIEGAGVSQFENHLRAICGLPLGTTETHSCAAMINFISNVPAAEKILAVPGCHFHDYGKQPRPGRKVGHATLRASTEAKLQKKIDTILGLLD